MLLQIWEVAELLLLGFEDISTLKKNNQNILDGLKMCYDKSVTVDMVVGS